MKPSMNKEEPDYNREYGNNRHLQTRAACGIPSELWEVMRPEMGKECPECFTIKTKKRKCIKCEEEFGPGCKLRFLCYQCHESNIRSYEG